MWKNDLNIDKIKKILNLLKEKNKEYKKSNNDK